MDNMQILFDTTSFHLILSQVGLHGDQTIKIQSRRINWALVTVGVKHTVN